MASNDICANCQGEDCDLCEYNEAFREYLSRQYESYQETIEWQDRKVYNPWLEIDN